MKESLAPLDPDAQGNNCWLLSKPTLRPLPRVYDSLYCLEESRSRRAFLNWRDGKAGRENAPRSCDRFPTRPSLTGVILLSAQEWILCYLSFPCRLHIAVAVKPLVCFGNSDMVSQDQHLARYLERTYSILKGGFKAAAFAVYRLTRTIAGHNMSVQSSHRPCLRSGLKSTYLKPLPIAERSERLLCFRRRNVRRQ